MVLGVSAIVLALVFGGRGGVSEPQPTAVTQVSVPGEPDGSGEPRSAETDGDEDPVAPERRIDPAWVARIAERTGIGERALEAYGQAASRIGVEQPECGLGWNTLAGIGHVESEHGTIFGGELAENGRADPPIRGIALDGTRTDAIPDTDGGELDGDEVWDRAVGPMQFIPSTWELWASDGDGDGIADPQDIDDAAYAAGRYLCSVGGDLRQPDNWIAAIAAYNNTIEYNNRVADAANHYAQLAG
ncbi:lytic murein transglycosylase [Leucobacter weissii]|uniref:Lytic murein transglycosylase n=2 Tax=Leucobacter weissii TaxID=1983706 RepID=A0A939MQR3_9MICO|nr:lytic murein transglycosylase [Leucobacter weissii]